MNSDFLLQTDRLTLRAFQPEDAVELHAILSQPEVVAWLPEDVMSLEETRAALARIRSFYEKNAPGRIRKFSAAVTLRRSGELVGWCGLGPLPTDESETEVYYGLSSAVWGRGIATEAAAAMLGYGFGEADLERIVAIVRPENPASRRVLEKIGMVYRHDLAGLPEDRAFFEGCHYFDLDRAAYREGRGPIV